MENASKALLIAAAVLIVILIVTISIKILSPSQDILEDAEEIGGTISSSSQSAVGRFESSLGTTQSKEEILSKIQIGDKVEYDEGSTDTKSSVDLNFKKENLEWRVLSKDESRGIVNLISTRPTTSKLTLSGETSWLNAETTLDNLCNQLYANGKEKGVEARSLKIEDIDKLAGITTDAHKKELNETYGYLYEYRKYGSYIQCKYSMNNGGRWLPYSYINTQVSYFKAPGESENPAKSIQRETRYEYDILSKVTETASDGISIAEIIANKKDVTQWLSSQSTDCYTNGNVLFCVRSIYQGYVGHNAVYQSSSKKTTYTPRCNVRPVVSLPVNLFGSKVNGVWQVNI